MRLYLALYVLMGLISLQGFGQGISDEDIYGKWRILGNFRNGEQTLSALKDTIKNPKHYYFYFNADGTYNSDVVSLKSGYRGKTMTGKWELDIAKMTLTKIRSLDRKEMKNIPSQWVRKNKDGTYNLVPVTYPILVFSRNKLVLYDIQHKTNNVYIR